jgi:hypothetical protein
MSITIASFVQAAEIPRITIRNDPNAGGLPTKGVFVSDVSISPEPEHGFRQSAIQIVQKKERMIQDGRPRRAYPADHHRKN